MSLLPLAVTTSGQGGEELARRARGAAARWKVPYVERRLKAPLGPMLVSKAEAFIVFGREGPALVDGAGELRATPGMAKLRIKRLDAGVDEDLLVRLGELRAGDAVLDCTLGLGADALVACRAVGPSGRVLGVEKSLPLFALAEEGLGPSNAGPRSCPLELRHGDCFEVLLACPDGAFDVVLFDPMFRRPRKASPAFELLRRHADHAALTPEHLAQARRVARRCVLIKAARYTTELDRLGLVAEAGSPYTSVSWARVRAA